MIGIDSAKETVTPTGAALLAAIGTRYGPVPEMTIHAVGYGAGTRDTPGRPNVLTAVLGAKSAVRQTIDPMVMIETTVDDVTGEVLGELVGELLQAGAADAWIAPVVGKKNRPAHVISALCTSQAAAAVEECLLSRTGSLGLGERLWTAEPCPAPGRRSTSPAYRCTSKSDPTAPSPNTTTSAKSLQRPAFRYVPSPTRCRH